MAELLTSGRTDRFSVVSYLPGTSPRKEMNSVMKWPKSVSNRMLKGSNALEIPKLYNLLLN